MVISFYCILQNSRIPSSSRVFTYSTCLAYSGGLRILPDLWLSFYDAKVIVSQRIICPQSTKHITNRTNNKELTDFAAIAMKVI